MKATTRYLTFTVPSRMDFVPITDEVEAVVAESGRPALAGSAPGWADAGVILPWTVWWRYGDTGIVDAHWASMVRFMSRIAAANGSGVAMSTPASFSMSYA